MRQRLQRVQPERDVGRRALVDDGGEAALVHELELVLLGYGELRHHRHRVLLELSLAREQGRHQQGKHVRVAHLHLVDRLDRQRRERSGRFHSYGWMR